MNVRGRDNRHSIAMVQKLGLRIYDYARYSMLWIIFLKQLEMGMEILQPRKKERSILRMVLQLLQESWKASIKLIELCLHQLLQTHLVWHIMFTNIHQVVL